MMDSSREPAAPLKQLSQYAILYLISSEVLICLNLRILNIKSRGGMNT